MAIEPFEIKYYSDLMDISNLEKVLAEQPAFRLRQAREAVFKNFISDWNQATFFAKDLRDKLNKECPLKIEADVLESQKEASVKARITLKDGLKVETVLMRHADPLRSEASGRNTVCVSCQVGCPLGCLFCATGKMGFKRNLSAEEILEQVVFFEKYLKKEKSRVTNVTYMGMGEPFLNYENVMDSIKVLNNKNYFNISARSISVSTAGIIEGIKKFSQEGLSPFGGSLRQVNLAISLHAPNDQLRKSLMPIDKKYPLQDVLASVDDYIKKTNRKVMFEYVLIKDINDSEQHATELAKIMHKKLYFLNLILYNPTPRSGSGQADFKPSTTSRVEKFKKILTKNKVNFVQRYRFGDDIKAACGQFATSK